MVNVNKRVRLGALTLLPVVALSMACASAPVSGVQPDGSFRETFEAFAVSMGTSNPPVIPSGITATVQINITRWTTAEERDALLTQLKENGQEGLVKSLQKQEETGWVVNRSTTTRSATARGAMGTSAPSQRLRYAWQTDLGGGKRRIVAALDRPIGFVEASRQTRWRDHDVTIITLDVDKKGQGEGQLAMGVRLAFEPEGKKLTIENFGSEPVRLTNVRRR
jgi:hypothetical protein